MRRIKIHEVLQEGDLRRYFTPLDEKEAEREVMPLPVTACS